MQVTAKLNYLRIAPRKVRLIADMIRKKKVDDAQTILSFAIKRGAQPILKVLNSAIANAKNNFQLDENNLYISKITVDEGPKLKRWRARARGRAMEIQKKTSHITLVLDEIIKKPKKEVKKVKKPKKVKEIKKAEIPERIKEVPKAEKPKLKPEFEERKPKIEKGIRRIFRRKAF